MKVQMDVSTIRIEQTYTLQRTKKKKKGNEKQQE